MTEILEAGSRAIVFEPLKVRTGANEAGEDDVGEAETEPKPVTVKTLLEPWLNEVLFKASSRWNR